MTRALVSLLLILQWGCTVAVPIGSASYAAIRNGDARDEEDAERASLAARYKTCLEQSEFSAQTPRESVLSHAPVCTAPGPVATRKRRNIAHAAVAGFGGGLLIDAALMALLFYNCRGGRCAPG